MANQALNNLKTIHNMQKEGSLLELLRDLRALKSQLEDHSKQLLASKKEKLAKQEAQKIKEQEQQKPKAEEPQKPQKSPSFSNSKTRPSMAWACQAP